MHATGRTHPYAAQATESSFDHLADQVWQMMHEMGSGNYFRSQAPRPWSPRLNLYETSDVFLVCLELAGMPREDIDVRAADGVLHIVGLRKKPTLPDATGDVSVQLMEIDSGRFRRKVPIPGDVNTDAIHAVYRHGYLWVIMPRTGETPTP